MKLPTIKLTDELIKEILKLAGVATISATGTYMIMKIRENKKRELTRQELEKLQEEIYDLYTQGIIDEQRFTRIQQALETLKRNY